MVNIVFACNMSQHLRNDGSLTGLNGKNKIKIWYEIHMLQWGIYISNVMVLQYTLVNMGCTSNFAWHCPAGGCWACSCWQIKHAHSCMCHIPIWNHTFTTCIVLHCQTYWWELAAHVTWCTLCEWWMTNKIVSLGWMVQRNFTSMQREHAVICTLATHIKLFCNTQYRTIVAHIQGRVFAAQEWQNYRAADYNATMLFCFWQFAALPQGRIFYRFVLEQQNPNWRSLPCCNGMFISRLLSCCNIHRETNIARVNFQYIASLMEADHVNVEKQNMHNCATATDRYGNNKFKSRIVLICQTSS